MDRLHKTLVLLLVAAIPAAAPPFFGSHAPAAPPATPTGLCFTAGMVTYRLLPAAAPADYRVKIDNGASDAALRIALVDRVETADFALVDDNSGFDRSPCDAAGPIKTIKTVTEGASDLTIRLAHRGEDGDLKLFVHSGRVGHRDAAALFAVIRHNQVTTPLGDPADEDN
jgi:hypothetical protein